MRSDNERYFYKGCLVIVKNVQFGESFFYDEVAATLEKIVNHAKNSLQEISVIDYQKAA